MKQLTNNPITMAPGSTVRVRGTFKRWMRRPIGGRFRYYLDLIDVVDLQTGTRFGNQSILSTRTLAGYFAVLAAFGPWHRGDVMHLDARVGADGRLHFDAHADACANPKRWTALTRFPFERIRLNGQAIQNDLEYFGDASGA